MRRPLRSRKNSETLLLGNGDLRDMPDVYRRVHESQVDGVLIGQAAEGNPWLFAGKEQVKQALRRVGTLTPQPDVSLAERFNVMLEHSRHYETVVQNHSFVGMRKNLLWYCCDFPEAAELQWQMKRVNSADDVEDILKNYIASRTDTLNNSNRSSHSTTQTSSSRDSEPSRVLRTII